MAKRQRSDSAAAAVAAFENAHKQIDPPDNVKLREGDRPFWDQIVRARALDTWTEIDLVHAGNLTACLADIERLKAEVAIEGDTVENHRGTMVVNPKHSLLETLSRRAVALSRSLHVHAEATVGKSEDAAKSLKNERKAKVATESADNLIAVFN